jgi:hypothetical protein
MTINIGGQNVILPGNIQQLLQQPHGNQVQKTSTSENRQPRFEFDCKLFITDDVIPGCCVTLLVVTTRLLEDEGVVKIPDAVVVRIPDEDNLFCTIFSLVLVF